MLSIGIAVASYKLLAVSADELHYIHIAEAMEMQRIYDHGKEHSMSIESINISKVFPILSTNRLSQQSILSL